MGKYEKLLSRILNGRSDADIAFVDLCNLLERLGFTLRIRGSHYIYRKKGVTEMINLQKDSDKAKPYQIRQVRSVILEYKLGGM